MTRSRLWFLPTLLAAGVACSGDPVATPTDPLDSELRAALAANGVAPLPPPPLQDANQVALGRLLMFDKIHAVVGVMNRWLREHLASAFLPA